MLVRVDSVFMRLYSIWCLKELRSLEHGLFLLLDRVIAHHPFSPYLRHGVFVVVHDELSHGWVFEDVRVEQAEGVHVFDRFRLLNTALIANIHILFFNYLNINPQKFFQIMIVT
jgi:hypothetical protein